MPDPIQLDEQGNPVYEALDDQGNPVLHTSVSSTTVDNQFTTKLLPQEETQFQNWVKQNKITDVDHPDSHYDYRGYWKEVGNKPIRYGVDHFPDTYKQPGHPTFSDESIYAKGRTDAGHWDGDKFIPPGQSQPGFLSKVWGKLNTGLIGEDRPLEEDVKNPSLKAVQNRGAAWMTSPLNLLGELAGGAGLAYGAYKGAQRLGMIGKAAETIPEVGKEADILAGESVKPMFNPKGQTGMTGTLQSKAKWTANIDGTLVDKGTGNIFNPKDKTLIIGQTTPQNLADLTEKGFVKTGEVIKEGPNQGRSVWIKKDAVEPTDVPPEIPKGNSWRDYYNLARGSTTTLDLSAPLRQGFTMIHTKEFWTNYGPMLKGLKSEEGFKNILSEINARPNAIRETEPVLRQGKWINKEKPSIYDRAGLAITDLADKREENLIGSLVEKALPGARASNRAYTAYLDRLRADSFDNLYSAAKALGEKVDDDHFLSELGKYVNTATGRGSLGSLEKNSQFLTDTLFSPRLMAARVKMLNPYTYVNPNIPPFVRKQYLKSALGAMTAWGTIAGMGKVAGANVNLDPSNADFMKIKIGNTRLDPGAGFQQFLVAAYKVGTGTETSSTSGKTRELGKGFQADTPFTVGLNFAANKLHPVPKFIYDIATASGYRPTELGDRILQMYTPLMIQDLTDLAREDPKLLPVGLASMLGMGTQTYEKGSKTHFAFPEKYDIQIKGRPIPDLLHGVGF